MAPIITGVLRFTWEPRKTRHTVPSALPLTIRLVRIGAVADPVPPIFTEEDFAIDFDQEFQRLVEQTRDFTAQQAMDQVYRRVVLYLCLSMLQPMDRKPNGLVKKVAHYAVSPAPKMKRPWATLFGVALFCRPEGAETGKPRATPWGSDPNENPPSPERAKQDS